MASHEFIDLGTAIRYVFHEAAGDISFTFDEFRENSMGVKSYVTCEGMAGYPSAGHLHAADLILTSTSGKDAYRKAVAQQDAFLDDARWRTLVELATQLALRHYRQGSPVIDLRSVDRTLRPRWLYEPWIEMGNVTDIFGDGSAGKSLFATAIALSVASGVAVLGGDVRQKMPVLYLDWETDEYTRSVYLEALCAGHDIDAADLSGFFYRREAASLERSAGHIRRVVAEQGIGLVVVDSRGVAASGGLELSEGTLGLFRAIRAVGVATLVVDHVNKAIGDKDKPYGNVYAHNSARITWGVTKIQDEGQPRMVTVLRNYKMNNGQIAPRRAYEVEFVSDDEDLMMAHYQPTTVLDEPRLVKEMPQAEQVAQVLRANSFPMPVKDICYALAADEIHIPSGQVRVLLNRYKARFQKNSDDEWSIVQK